ncbi:MAG TPA: alpha-galactosidase [Propionibacteriaceae bacterium]|mgnify:CR=1 FL=1|nr:alpha-galactosidase [Propionibacteriaceae bacterium]
MSYDCTVALTSAGVSLWLEVSQGRLPSIVHWGAAMPDPSDTAVRDAATAGLTSNIPNGIDAPVHWSVLPEMGAGVLGRPGVVGHRDRTAWSPRWVVSAVRVAGGEHSEGLYVGGPAVVEVDAADPANALGLRLEIELLASGLVRTRATLTNLADGPYNVDSVTPSLPVPTRAAELLDLAGHWSSERTPQRLPFAIGAHVRENRRGRTGADSAYVLHAGTQGFTFRTGEVWGMHVAWSGNHLHMAERTALGQRLLVGGELLLPGEVVLHHGESYASPWVYGSYGTGLDGVAGRFHDYLRARETHVDHDRPVTLNCWEAVYFDHQLDRLVDLIDRAADLGVERFVLDDGWFGSRRDDSSGLGDWVVSDEVWPDGLGALVEACTSRGMQFGLWFEPEMVNLDSALARQHPDWVMQVPGRLPLESRHQQVLNLTIPECYDHIRNAMVALLDAYDISSIKWDHNRDLTDPGTVPLGGRAAVHAQTLQTYRLMAELKAHQPGLEIESCASGGSRADLGVMEICDRIWGSDCTEPAERLRINRWTYQLLPPELIGSHVAAAPSHQTGRIHHVAFRAASALFGHFGIEWDLASVPDDDIAQLRSWVRLYKQVRDLVGTGTLVRGDTEDPQLYLTGIVSAEQDRAIYTLAATTTPTLTSLWGRIRLEGLDPDRAYHVRPMVPGVEVATFPGIMAAPWFGQGIGSSWEGGTYSGAVLIELGLQAPFLIPDYPLLLLVREV